MSRCGRVFLPVYVMQLVAFLALAVAARYLGTTPNPGSGVSRRDNLTPTSEHETLTPSTPSAAGLQIGHNVQLDALINISKFWSYQPAGT